MPKSLNLYYYYASKKVRGVMKLRNYIIFIFSFSVLISFVSSNPVVLSYRNTTEFSEWKSRLDDRNNPNVTDTYDSDPECDCGPHSISCELTYLNDKRCTCKSGYVALKKLFGEDDTCKECNCGTYMSSCNFDIMGQRRCTCKSGSVIVKGYNDLGDQKCVECDCGINAISCKIDYSNRKVCNCMFGYDLRPGDTECKHYGDGSLSSWKIGTIVISIIFSAIIVTLCVKIMVKQCDE